MKGKGLTVEQLNTIAEHWDTDEKRYLRRLQRIYNTTVKRGDLDNDCLCTRTRRKVWIAWFRAWALENKYFEYE